MRTLVIVFLLFVLLIVALSTYQETHAQPNSQPANLAPTLKESRRMAWEQGYWIGASNGVAAAQQQVQIAKKGAPPNAEVFRQQLLSGMTNNPYKN
jgi:hypothetical protein